MMGRDLSIILATVILVSCASTSNKQSWAPPGQSFISQLESESTDKESLQMYLQRFLERHKELSAQWWGKYQLAKLHSTNGRLVESCQLYKELGSDENFPLQTLADLRQHEVCEVDKFDLNKLHKITGDKDAKWLHELAGEIGYKRAKEQGNNLYQSKFSFELSYHAPIQSEKIERINEAIKLATLVGDQALTSEYRTRLYKIAPRLAPGKKRKKISQFKLAFDYRRARDFKKAKRIYTSILNNKASSADQIFRALQGLRAVSKITENKKDVIHYSSRKDALSMKWFLSAKKNKKSTRYYANLYHKAALQYARTLWTEDQRTRAINTLNRAAKTLQGYANLSNIYWIQARIEEERGRFNSVVKYARLGLSGLEVSSPIWEKLKWQLAWNLRKIKKYEEAIQVFTELGEKTDSNFSRSKYLFWQGRTYAEKGETELASEKFERLIKEDPLGYYGVLAFRELKQPISALADRGLVSPRPTRAPASLDVLDRTFLQWLISVNERAVARSYLLSKKSSVKTDKDRDTLIKFLALAGEYNWVFSYLAQSEPETRNEMVLSSPSLLFPRPYLDIVAESSQRFGVPSELVYAIMRQESGFNRYARSPADAFGLMQMLPRVAKKTGRSINVKVSSGEDLYNPSVIIPLGAHHLKELMDKYDNQFILAVASYNASENAVRGWVKTRFRDDPLEFIEDIPYDETKGYIKLVLRNMVFYQRLMNEGATPFPEWCLTGLHPFKS